MSFKVHGPVFACVLICREDCGGGVAVHDILLKRHTQMALLTFLSSCPLYKPSNVCIIKWPTICGGVITWWLVTPNLYIFLSFVAQIWKWLIFIKSELHLRLSFHFSLQAPYGLWNAGTGTMCMTTKSNVIAW